MEAKDGLNVQKMSELYGGKQPIMRNTVLTKEKVFFGPYQQKFQVGDIQYL
jgi:hypothetical protein